MPLFSGLGVYGEAFLAVSGFGLAGVLKATESSFPQVQLQNSRPLPKSLPVEHNFLALQMKIAVEIEQIIPCLMKLVPAVVHQVL